MFDSTFKGCSGLTGNIPSNLFAGISGAPATSMFAGTFWNCSGLTGSIPDGLFGNISGAPAAIMFSGTFYGCSGLTGSIPDGLFGNISGKTQTNLFTQTFKDCSGLTGPIPDGLFGELSGEYEYAMFYNTFNGCSNLTGPAARNGGEDNRFLHEIWPNVAMEPKAYVGTKIDDRTYIPTSWGGGGKCRVDHYKNDSGTCTACPAGTSTYGSLNATSVEDCKTDDVFKFTVTTTSDTTEFSFKINASGKFYVDCGSDASGDRYPGVVSHDTITCAWDTANEHTIRIGGLATEYNSYAAISFYQNTNLATIDGSLGAIFPTIENDDGSVSQPMFFNVFNGCTNLTSIPGTLFQGIKGQPINGMFQQTFYGCSGLTGPIPDGLFGDLSGEPAESMFFGTFSGCSSLTGPIPDGVFGNLSGAPAEDMFYYTFNGCSSLTGPAARNGGDDNLFLHEIWPDVETKAYSGTKINGLAYIPKTWGGGGQTCAVGNYFDNTGACIICPANYYCPDVSSDPSPCPSHMGVDGLSLTGNTNISGCYIEAKAEWSFSDSIGSGVRFFNNDCSVGASD